MFLPSGKRNLILNQRSQFLLRSRALAISFVAATLCYYNTKTLSASESITSFSTLLLALPSTLSNSVTSSILSSFFFLLPQLNLRLKLL